MNEHWRALVKYAELHKAVIQVERNHSYYAAKICLHHRSFGRKEHFMSHKYSNQCKAVRTSAADILQRDTSDRSQKCLLAQPSIAQPELRVHERRRCDTLKEPADHTNSGHSVPNLETKTTFQHKREPTEECSSASLSPSTSLSDPVTIPVSSLAMSPKDQMTQPSLLGKRPRIAHKSDQEIKKQRCNLVHKLPTHVPQLHSSKRRKSSTSTGKSDIRADLIKNMSKK